MRQRIIILKPVHRSLAGLAIAIVALPAFLALMACLPVPVGDPEKSRIDPDLNGIWLHSFGDDDGIAVSLLEPYDKRTWLVQMYGLDVSDEEDCAVVDEELDEGDDEAVRAYDDWVAALESASGCYVPSGTASYKVWQTTLAETRLMTWELKGAVNDNFGFGSGWWYVFRLDEQSADRFVLPLINFEYDALDELFESEEFEWLEEAEPPYDPRKLRSARRAVERLIRRNIDDEELFMEDEFWLFERIRPEHYELFLDPLDDVMPDPN